MKVKKVKLLQTISAPDGTYIKGVVYSAPFKKGLEIEIKADSNAIEVVEMEEEVVDEEVKVTMGAIGEFIEISMDSFGWDASIVEEKAIEKKNTKKSVSKKKTVSKKSSPKKVVPKKKTVKKGRPKKK